MVRFGVLVAGVLMAGAAGAAAAEVPREIVVTGEARVEATPDMATVSAGVESQGATAAEALADNAAAMRAVLEGLAAAGIEPRDVQTRELRLEPVYHRRDGGEWTTDVEGYIARNMVTVRVREIAEVGRIIDRMHEAGVNRIAGIGFDIAEPRVHEDTARERAVADARAKAELYARAAGVDLGEVVTIRETQPFDRPFPMRAQMEMAMDGAIAEGAIEIQAMVEIVFAIADDSEDNGEDEGGAD